MTQRYTYFVLVAIVGILTACSAGPPDGSTEGTGGVVFYDNTGGTGGGPDGGMDCRAPKNQALFMDGSPWPCRQDCYQTCPGTGGVCYATCPNPCPMQQISCCRPLTCEDYPAIGPATLSDGCGGTFQCP